MVNIKKTIKEARERGASDDLILNKIIEENPEKEKLFEEAKKRGASTSAILKKIIEDNAPIQKKKEVEAKEAENKKEDLEKKKRKKKKKEKKEEKKEKKEEKAKKKNLKKKKEKKDKSIKESFTEKVALIKNSQFVGELLSATRYLLVGVDISDHSIEVILLDQKGSISSYGRSVLEEGLVENGEIVNQKKLSEILKETLRNTKPQPLDLKEHTRKKAIELKKKDHKAIISLPDSKTYIQVFKFENKQNLYNQVRKEVENKFPFDPEELYWDFLELPSDQGIKILCVAALRDVVDMYIYFFKSTNIEPVAFEIEGASIGRALLPIKNINKKEEKKKKKKKKKRQVMADGKERMIIDMGARTSVLSIFNKDAKLALSVPLPYAGYYFTKKISEGLNLSKKEAEKIKQEKGFREGTDIFPILKEQGEKIIKEIKRAQKYYKREFDGEIKEILLAGGTSLLPDIIDFLDKRIENVEVKIGNPLKKINEGDFLNEKESVLYSNVIGLGLRSLMDDPINQEINLLPEEVKSQAEKSQKENYRSILIVALFITIAGIVLLGLSTYYLVYLPVPAPIQPLQDRILLRVEEDDDVDVEMIDMAVVRVDLQDPTPVYRGPGDEQEIIGEAFPGESYRATGQRTGWVRIEIDDVEGWIYRDKLEMIESIEIETTTEEDLEESAEEEIEREEEVSFAEISERVGSGGLNVREENNLNSQVLTTVQAGEIFELLNREGGWVMIKVEDEEGWVSENFLTIIEEQVRPEEEIEDTIQRLMR